MRVKMQQLGPGMYTQSTGPCDECRGQGEVINEKDKCKTCNGKKVNKEKKVLEVQIDKGSPNGEKQVFHGEADEYPSIEPGDVIIQVVEQPHELFKRKGADILFEKEISLVEALCGLSFNIKHLDGRIIKVTNEPGEVIKSDEIKTIQGQGMPYHKQSYKFGNMFIVFKIKFPETLQAKQLELISQALGRPKAENEDMDVAETVKLQKYSEDHRNTHHEGGNEGNDSGDEDDEDGRGGQRVRCQ